MSGNQQGRRLTVMSLVVVVALVAPQWGCADAAAPNILFVFADDLGWGDLGSHGHPVIKTPNLDQLAREGTDFRQFTVASPSCSPSRAAILTGHFPARHGVHQPISHPLLNIRRGVPDWLDPTVPLLPRLLQEAGYRTAHYGKWHLAGGSMYYAPPLSEYGYDDSAVYRGWGRHVFDDTSLQEMVRKRAAHDPVAASYLSKAATEHALRFIRESGDAPFYINLWLHETHHLVAATEEEKSAYRDTPEPHRTYYAAVTRLDRQIGRLLSLLEELGKADNTIVIFSSDNGPEVPSARSRERLFYSVGSAGGRRGGKRSLYLGGVGVPFIVRWPGRVPAGRVDDTAPVSAVDLLPTLLAAAGVPLPDGYRPDGENVLPLWLGEEQAREKPLFWDWEGNRSEAANWASLAMRQGRWTFLTDASGERRELYDVIEDPEQRHNLATQQPERVESMLAAVRAWKAELPTSPRAIRREISDETWQAHRADLFRRLDTSRDRQLSLAEYRRRPKSPEFASFADLDVDGDKTLTPEEFSRRENYPAAAGGPPADTP